MSLPDRSPPQTSQSSSDTDHSGFNVTTSDTNSTPSSDPNSPLLKSELEILLKLCSFGFKWFSHDVLKIITSQFSPENLIGKGGSNQVYKVLPDGKKVVVKILNSSEEESWKEFATEIGIITSLKHKHITNLIGICFEDNNLISVYDYLPKGSLDENCHPTKNRGEVLSWQVRFDIAVGVAEALCYLHDGCSRPIIHRVVKSSNILLSDTLDPQPTGPAVGCPMEPWHDLHCLIDGPAAYDVLTNFEERWSKALKPRGIKKLKASTGNFGPHKFRLKLLSSSTI